MVSEATRGGQEVRDTCGGCIFAGSYILLVGSPLRRPKDKGCGRALADGRLWLRRQNDCCGGASGEEQAEDDGGVCSSKLRAGCHMTPNDLPFSCKPAVGDGVGPSKHSYITLVKFLNRCLSQSISRFSGIRNINIARLRFPKFEAHPSRPPNALANGKVTHLYLDSLDKGTAPDGNTPGLEILSLLIASD